MEFDQAVAELDLLVDTLERDGDERALMLLQLMDAVHRPALELIVAGQLGHPVAYAVLSMYDLAPLEDGARTLSVTAAPGEGGPVEIEATVRIDTATEWLYYRHGGILPFVLRQLLERA